MSDQSEQPQGGYEPIDPWAPPEKKTSLDKEQRQPYPGPQSPAPGGSGGPGGPGGSGGSVHDLPTVIGMPGSGPGAAAVPPPPQAPSGPSAPPQHYGYPVYPSGPAPAPAPPYPGVAGYGYPGYPAYGQLGPQQGNRDGMGTAALVLGIISVVGFCLVGVDILIGGLALTLGILGRARARKGVASNGGVALAGMILGAVGVVFATVFLVFVIWASNQDENERDSTDRYPTYDTSLVVPR